MPEVRQLQAELWQQAEAVLGEGPNWDGRHDRLSWVDVVSSKAHVAGPDGRSLRSFELPGHVGAALPAAEGGWLVALADRLAHLDEEGGLTDVVPLEAHLPGNRANDAKCDPSGRAWIGTMSYDESVVSGSLYRLGPGPEVAPVLQGVGIANGLGWSPDARTMYFIDTVTHEVRAYPFDLSTGDIGRPRAVARVDEADGHPDGMCVDSDGCLWVALFAGGCVRRYTPDGRLDTVVRVPATYTTSCCFGGVSGDLLLITTATRDLDEQGRRREPLAGSVWAVEPGVSGPPATPWVRPARG